MAQNNQDQLYQQLMQLKNSRPAVEPTSRTTTGPSMQAQLNYRDYVINSMRSAPTMQDRIQEIAAGNPTRPLGAFGNLGKFAATNPITKGILGGLTAIDVPRRVVISGIKELKDSLDGDASTQASMADFKSQVADPTFGFGRVIPMDGWGGRIIGFIGDVALDPLTWGTLGGTILKESVTQTGKVAAHALEKELAELTSEELIAGGAQRLGAQITAAGPVGQRVTKNTREFLGGIKSLNNRKGSEALASGAAKLGATEAEVAEILKRGRLGVPEHLAELMGLNNYGLYYFGSRVRVPFTGMLGRGVAVGLTAARLGILSTRPGEFLARMATANGTAAGMSLRDIRFAGRAGKAFPDNLTPRMGLAILDGENAMRGAKGTAARDGAIIIHQALNHPDVVAEADVLYKYLDPATMPTVVSDRQRRAMAVIKTATDKLFDNIQSYGIHVADGDVNGFQIAKWRDRYFPHKMTQAAQDFVENHTSKRAADIRQYLKIDHTNIGGSFESRNLERLVNMPDSKVDWFGTILTKEHIDGGIDTLNDLARKGGFKGDFFETNVNRALTSYLTNYAEGIGTIAFYQSLKEAGSDIGGMAVKRGMITQDALSSLVGDTQRAHNVLVASYQRARQNATEYVNSVIKAAKQELSTQQKVAGLSKEELEQVLLGGADATKIGAAKSAAGAQSDAAAKALALDNLTKAKEVFAAQRAAVIKNHLSFLEKFETVSFVAAEANAKHNTLVDTLNLIDKRLDIYQERIAASNTVDVVERARMIEELGTLTDAFSIELANVESSINSLGQHTMEFVNDAMADIVDDVLGTGKNWSSPVRDLHELAKYGKIFSGKNKIPTSRGISEGLGEEKIRFYLNMQASGVATEASAPFDAWVKLKDMLQLGDVTRNKLTPLLIGDVRNTLVRAAASVDPNEVGAVREAISWLFVRAQMDDPGFAMKMLANPTEEFTMIRNVMDTYAMRAKFAVAEVAHDKLGNVVYRNIDELPAELRNSARLIEITNKLSKLSDDANQVLEHLARVPDVRKNPIHSSFASRYNAIESGTRITEAGYNDIISHLKTLEKDYGSPELTHFIDNLERVKSNRNSIVTIDELSDDIEARFGNSITGKQYEALKTKATVKDVTDFRLSAAERELYPGAPNEEFRVRILRKQRQIDAEITATKAEHAKLTHKLSAEQQAEVSTLINQVGLHVGDNAAINAMNLSEGTMALAKAVTNFYLDQETKFVLRQGDAILAPIGDALTPRGVAQLMNVTYSKFAESSEAHLMKLHKARAILDDIASNLMNSGKNGADMKLELISALRRAFDTPGQGEVLEELFPGIAMQVALSRVGKEAALLASSSDYRKFITTIADLEMSYYAVSPTYAGGDAGVIHFKDSADALAVKELEQGRRLTEATLGSEGLQRSQIIEKIEKMGTHKARVAYLNNLKQHAGYRRLTSHQRREIDYNIAIWINEGTAVADGLKRKAVESAKKVKELSAKSGGPESQRIRTLQREAKRSASTRARQIGPRIDVDPNSLERLLARAFHHSNTSVRPIKEFFAALFGGDAYAVPTLRGSEAGRLVSLSQYVVRPEDSYFGRSIVNSRAARDNASKRIFSTNPSEAEVLFQRTEYAKYLEQRLADLEQKIKDRPEAMKMLAFANKELAAAEKATLDATGQPLSYEQRLAYLDQLAVLAPPFGERAPYTRTFNPDTGTWSISRGPKKVPTDLEAAKQLPIPEEGFSQAERTRIKSYLAAKTEYDKFVAEEQYQFAERAAAIKGFKDELSAVDLTKVEWTSSGDTLNSVVWDEKVYAAIAKIVGKPSAGPGSQAHLGRAYGSGQTKVTNLPFVPSDIVFSTPKASFTNSIANYTDPFGKDVNALIARMSDLDSPELIFLNADSAEFKLRVARDAEGKPLGYFERLMLKQPSDPRPLTQPPTGVDPNLPYLDVLPQHPYEAWDLFDPKSEYIHIIEPQSVPVDGSSVRKIREVGSVQEMNVLNPDETWVRITSHAGSSEEDILAFSYAHPPRYERLSSLLPNDIRQPLTTPNGQKFEITDLEQLALHTDFDQPVYKQLENGGVFARRVQSVQNTIATKEKAMKDIVRTIANSRGQIKDTQRKLFTIFKSDLEEAKQELATLLHAQKVWNSRKTAEAKVAYLYTMFDRSEPIGKQIGLGSGNRNPRNSLKDYLRGQNSPELKESIAVPDSVVAARRTLINKNWQMTPEATIMNRAGVLKGAVNATIIDYGDSAERIVANLIKAKEQVRNLGKLNGLTADMERIALQDELKTQGIQFPGATSTRQAVTETVEETPVGSTIPSISKKTTYQDITTEPTATLGQLRKGVEQVKGQVDKEVRTGPFVESPGRRQLMEQKLHQVDELELSAERQQIVALQADIDWMDYTRQTVLKGGQELGKRRPGVAKAVDKAAAVAAKANAELAELSVRMNNDPLKGFPLARKARDLGLTPSPMPDQQAVLARSQNAFDASSVLHTDSDITTAIDNIQRIGTIIESGTKAKAALKQLKGHEGYKAFVTEFQMFADQANQFLKLVSNPKVDKSIRDQALKWVNGNLEYLKQASSISDSEHIAKIGAGMAKGHYYNKAGERVEGNLVGENTNMRDLYPAMEWIEHFDDGMVRLGKQFPNIQVAAPIAEFVQNVHRLNEPAIAMELNRFLGQYTRFFKAYATLSPGFHIRNSISNGFMLFAAGGNPKYLLEGMQMSRSLNEASKKGLSVEEWIISLPRNRQSQARIAVRASAASGGGNAADNLRHLYMSGRLINNLPTRMSKGLGQWIEGHSRFMLAYDGAMQGMDFNTSAARVQRFLIDYEDVSTLDKSLRQIIPFWMWTSRNLPMQVQNIWLNPRAYQIYGNAKRNFTKESEPNEIIPIWMKEMGAFKLPFGQNLYATPDIGFNRIQADVNMLQDPSRFLSNVNPLIRLPIELTGEKQFFSNKRFSKTPVEVEGVGGAIQPLLEALGYGQTGADGKKYVNDKALYALRNLLPMLSRSESLNPSIVTNQDVGANPLLGFLGAPIRQNTPRMQESELLRRQYEMMNAVQNFKATQQPQG